MATLRRAWSQLIAPNANSASAMICATLRPSDDARVHAQELDGEATDAGEHEVLGPESRALVATRPQEGGDGEEPCRLVELRRVNPVERRRRALREGDAEGSIRRAAVVVADEEASDASERLPDRSRETHAVEERAGRNLVDPRADDHEPAAPIRPP